MEEEEFKEYCRRETPAKYKDLDILKECINILDSRIDKLLDVLVEKKLLTNKERQKVYDGKNNN